jgi:hypothetical protein
LPDHKQRLCLFGILSILLYRAPVRCREASVFWFAYTMGNGWEGEALFDLGIVAPGQLPKIVFDTCCKLRFGSP